MSGAEETGQERKPWDQMEGEPDRWYGRFQVYLELGLTRTLKGRRSCGRPADARRTP